MLFSFRLLRSGARDSIFLLLFSFGNFLPEGYQVKEWSSCQGYWILGEERLLGSSLAVLDWREVNIL